MMEWRNGLFVLLLVLLLPCAALGEATEEGVVLYDECLRPYACFLPGAPLEDAAQSSAYPLYTVAGWNHIAFPEVYDGAVFGYICQSVGEAAPVDGFPQATLLHDFALESANAMLGWEAAETNLKQGDTVHILGMSADRWFVYAGGHYGSIPKVVYGLDAEEAAQGYLEVDADTAARLHALIPSFALSAEAYRQQRSAYERQLADAYATYGAQPVLWPWAVQQSVAEAGHNVALTEAWSISVAAPSPNDWTQEEAIAMASEQVQEVLGDVFPLEACHIGATFRWDTVFPGWDVTFVSAEDTIKVRVGAVQAELVRDNVLHSFPVLFALSNYWAAQDASFAEQCAAKGQLYDWPYEDQVAWSPNLYMMPDERCISMAQAEEIAMAHCTQTGLANDPLQAKSVLERIPASYGADAPGFYVVNVWVETAWVAAVYVDAVTGQVISDALGNG